MSDPDLHAQAQDFALSNVHEFMGANKPQQYVSFFRNFNSVVRFVKFAFVLIYFDGKIVKWFDNFNLQGRRAAV